MAASYLILCIENTSLPLTRFRHGLLGADHRIVTAITATRGLELAESGNPDLILLDLDVSDGGRFELVRKIKQSEITAHVPIILLTNGLEKEDLITARGLGVVDFVTRPYKMQILEEKVARALKNRIRPVVEAQQHLVASSGAGQTTLLFRPGWKSTIQADVRRILTPEFLRQHQKDALIFDLRALPVLAADEVSIIDRLLQKLSGLAHPVILAGRHFGALVSHGDLESKAHIFLTREELETFLKGRASGVEKDLA